MLQKLFSLTALALVLTISAASAQAVDVQAAPALGAVDVSLTSLFMQARKQKPDVAVGAVQSVEGNWASRSMRSQKALNSTLFS